MFKVKGSASDAREKVKSHFQGLEKTLTSVLSSRMSKLLSDIEEIERTNTEPLQQCEDMINRSLADATACMEQGNRAFWIFTLELFITGNRLQVKHLSVSFCLHPGSVYLKAIGYQDLFTKRPYLTSSNIFTEYSYMYMYLNY